MNPLLKLIEQGQSYWLDNLTREMIENGELEQRVRSEGLRGITSNPSTFSKAISGGSAYDAQIAGLDGDVSAVYEALATTDVRNACDILRPVYDSSHGADGFVSIEVSPHLARDAEATLIEARRLWQTVDRPNVLIKIPGTAEGVSAIERALVEGINVNITLLFSVPAYQAVAKAYIRALERRVLDGKPVDKIASVASFFLSRIDVLVDGRLQERLEQTPAPETTAQIRDLVGKVAVANAKLAYQWFKANLMTERWLDLAGEGARVQRLLWASTSTKNPDYHDLMYVEPLIGPDTVNTMPESTIDAFRDHGKVQATLESDLSDASGVMGALELVGIDFDDVARQLEDEGIQKFVDPFDDLMRAIAEKRGR